jgi:hypothetical protein
VNFNSAKSLLDKRVNLHLDDGSVIVNVQLSRVWKADGRRNMVEYRARGEKAVVPLLNVIYAISIGG